MKTINLNDRTICYEVYDFGLSVGCIYLSFLPRSRAIGNNIICAVVQQMSKVTSTKIAIRHAVVD